MEYDWLFREKSNNKSIAYKNQMTNWVLAAHTCNPGYLGG
jgi:hypothetical protein